MKSARMWMTIVLAVAVFALMGCAKKKTAETTPPAEQNAPQTAAAHGEMAEHEEAGSSITPAGTVPEIWAQISGEQTKLSSVIENGQLGDVHHLAFGIRDLVSALAEKAGASNPAVAAQLKAPVEQVAVSASKLDELGDAGNLSGTQVEYASLVKILDGIKAITSGM